MDKTYKDMVTIIDNALFINGEFIEGGETFDVINPATEQVIAKCVQGNEDDVNVAVSYARRAFEGEWSKVSGRERAKYLYAIAENLRQNLQEFATLETLNNGKPISETMNADLPLAIECFEYYASLADKIGGQTVPMKEGFFNYTLREPVGVVAQIIPWNFPLLMLAWKLGPALATGCTVVLKPAEQTPLTALRFAKLLQEVNLPKGVVNIVTGDGRTGKLLSENLNVDKIAFTGSTEVGRLVGATAGKNIKRVSLELGGKAPNIIFADANLDDAVEGIILSIFFNQGEVCCAGSRLYVEESIKDQLIEKLVARTKKLVQGNPLDPQTNIGAQVSEEQYKRILNYITQGRKQGAKVLLGGYPVNKKGYFIEPTILEATDDNICAREEIFGPVVTILTFNDYDDVVKRANNTNYGLSAGIWTRDIGKAHKLAKAIRAGTVWVNCYNVFDAASPFGGYKDSGNGRELGVYALDLYTEIKSVILPLS